MSSGKDGTEEKKGAIAKAAGIAMGVGIAWGVFRFVQARKEEDALIREYYGDREDFVVPDSDASDSDVDKVPFKEEFETQKILLSPPPPPPPPIVPPHEDELRIERQQDDTQVTEEPKPLKPEPKSEEKPWFLRLFDPPMKAENKPKITESGSFDAQASKPKETESYPIKKGDTLWAISRRYGVSVDAVKVANGLHADHIYAGEKLVIPEN